MPSIYIALDAYINEGQTIVLTLHLYYQLVSVNFGDHICLKNKMQVSKKLCLDRGCKDRLPGGTLYRVALLPSGWGEALLGSRGESLYGEPGLPTPP